MIPRSLIIDILAVPDDDTEETLDGLPNSISIKQEDKDQKPSNNFATLPDEIVLFIFKFLGYSWSQLLQLRLVCKQWSRLLVDRTIKYSQLTEELKVMLNNEVEP